MGQISKDIRARVNKNYKDMKTFDILSELPDEANYVLVLDVDKIQRWKRIQDIIEQDSVVLGERGPIFSETKPGRITNDEKNNRKLNKIAENENPVAVATPSPSHIPSGNQEREIYLKEKRKAIDNNPLVKTVKENPDSLEALKYIITLLAQEIAEMEYEKRVADDKGLIVEGIWNKKMRVLRVLSDIWLKHKELKLQEKDNAIDLNSPSFKRLFAFIIEMFSQLFLDVLIDNRIDTNDAANIVNMLMIKISKEISDESWILRAKKSMDL